MDGKELEKELDRILEESERERKKHRWTPKEIAIAKAMQKRGISIRKIAKEMGVTYGAIRHVLYQL